ncbi:transcription factor MYB80 [Brachypodium distachyon]|uniref:Uncharacterized protein n=1 Tax=Brachypodium distachyon TaxID=15368 RepID=A0A0Q3E5T8_BRADI|nr:transcription factor MYB80 [Brachypodium distachyon]KQJ83102.1 hypothetical protein BRADI_5g13041v3 [Brachypodium distachyon]|eukprot:XP_003579943.2 transcription factor MYB80 [Brachypodium distachyon]
MQIQRQSISSTGKYTRNRKIVAARPPSDVRTYVPEEESAATEGAESGGAGIDMGRIPCCEKESVKRGQWTPEEDNKLRSHIAQNGTRNWRLIPKNAGLQRCGKSCRLRWTNYLRPDLKHGEFTDAEEQTIIKLHSVVGNRWSVIAAQLPGRTDNDVKNHWNTKLKKKLSGMGIDPVTHKSFSHLMAEIATTLAPPQVAHLAEAALGCFKDEMLHLLTKKRPTDFPSPAVPDMSAMAMGAPCFPAQPQQQQAQDDTIERIKMGLSRAIMSEPAAAAEDDKPWPQPGDMSEMYAAFNNATPHAPEFRYEGTAAAPGYLLGGDGGDQGTSMWSSHHSMYSGSSGTEGACRPALQEKGNDSVGSSGGDDEAEEDCKESGKGGSDISGLFGSDCVLWDLPDELTNHMV